MTTEPITLDESRQLLIWESVIQSGRTAFLDVGTALASIRDHRLYRSDHATFEAYCRDKWNLSRQHINQLIAGASAVRSLPPKMESMLSNSSQASALSKVEPAKRVEVLEAASAQAESENRPLRAKDIAEAAKEEKPVTMDEQWKGAMGKPALPEINTIESRIHDQDIICEEIVSAYGFADLGYFKLCLEVWVKKISTAIKAKKTAFADHADEVPKLLEYDEDIIQKCIETIRDEQKASVSLLQRRHRLGYVQAARIMDVIEKRGLVGPAKGSEPREILIENKLSA